MPDFSKLLSRTAGQAKSPKTLVPGNYPAIIKSHEILPAPEGKDYEFIIRFQIGLLGWPDSAVEEDKTQDLGNGEVPIDLSKKQIRRDFYDNSLKRLDDLIRSCGVEPGGRSYQEVLPELTGAHVTAEVQQYLNQRTNDLGNQIGNLVGAA